MCIRVHVYMYICIYVYMYICMYVYMYICIYVYMYICICVYMYICIYVCPWAPKKHYRAQKKRYRAQKHVIGHKKRPSEPNAPLLALRFLEKIELISTETLYIILVYIHIYCQFARRTIYSC